MVRLCYNFIEVVKLRIYYKNKDFDEIQYFKFQLQNLKSSLIYLFSGFVLLINSRTLHNFKRIVRID